MAAKHVTEADLPDCIECTRPVLRIRIPEVGNPAHAGVAGRNRASLRAEDKDVSRRMCPAVELEVQIERRIRQQVRVVECDRWQLRRVILQFRRICL